MLVFGLADVALALEEELGVIPGSLVGKEGGCRPFINGDELWSNPHLIIVHVELGPGLRVVDNVEDLAEHPELGGLAGVRYTPLPTGPSLALGLQQAVLDEVVYGLLVPRLLNSSTQLIPALLGGVGFNKFIQGVYRVNLHLVQLGLLM